MAGCGGCSTNIWEIYNCLPQSATPMFQILVSNCHTNTGCAIKNWSHTFNHTCSHDRNPSNFKSAFICYLSELSFEVYNSFLGQLAKKWGVIKVWSPKQKCLEKVHFTSLAGYNLNFFANFELTPSWFLHWNTNMCVFWQLRLQKMAEKFKLLPVKLVKYTFFRLFCF